MKWTIRTYGDSELVAESGRRVVGRWVWSALPGGAVLVVDRSADEPEIDAALASAAVERFRSDDVRFAQLTMSPQIDPPQHLIAAGFHPLTELVEYRRPTQTETALLPRGLSLEPIRKLTSADLKTVWDETLIDTLDCPELNDCRGPSGLPAGFDDPRADADAPSSAAILHGRCVGIIFGKIRAIESIAEIHYLGVIPAVRRSGIASVLLSHFPSSSGVAAAVETTVAVDARNDPARRLYERNLFRSYGSYRVWVWINSSTSRPIHFPGKSGVLRRRAR